VTVAGAADGVKARRYFSGTPPAGYPRCAMSEPAATIETVSPNDRDRVWLVIAAFNEGGAIAPVVAGALDDGWPHVVVVDDGSADDTAERARQAGAHTLRHLVNRGQGAALQTGIRYALERGAEVLVTFDADGQHRTADLPAMVGPVLRGEVDAALGSRFLDHAEAVPVGRRLLLRAARLFGTLTSGVRLTDAHNGFRALSRRLCVEHIDLRLDRMAHASEIVDQIAASGLPFREVSVRIEYTDYSRQKGQRGSAALRIAVDYLLGRLLG
jgi:glycosyltransferase involved in cell wall biosynthesis